MIRVGSRSASTDKNLNECNLKEKKKIFKRKKGTLDHSHMIREEMDNYKFKIEMESRCIKLLREGIIHEKHLQCVMEPHLFKSLVSKQMIHGDSQIVFWLQGTIQYDTEEDEKPILDEKAIKPTGIIFDHDKPNELDFQPAITFNHMETLPELALSKSQICNNDMKKTNGCCEWETVGRKQINRQFRLAHNKKDVMTNIEIQRLCNVWQLNDEDRWRLYRVWVTRYCSSKEQSIQMLYDSYNKLAEQLKEARDEIDYNVLRDSHVIGMTTTGAARYRHILQRLQSQIVIVEEAAEVLEAHIVTTLSRDCQHLILIGDHQQLRPNPSSYNLAKNYHLDISLFERMVKNKIHCEQLRIQHRMRPEIAQLLVPHIYKDLENHQSVFLYPNIKGIHGNMFFINHTEMEAAIDDSKSHSNVHEAEFCGSFVRYLMQQGYSASQITILTAYTGQMYTINKVLANKHINEVLVTPVDGFQGEENDIIILSMVRSNEDGKIGFLSIENRICVALSRAKMGFYAIGNISQLENASNLWSNISTSLRRNHQLVDGLPLVCQNHSGNKSCIKKAEDFDQVPDGGCYLPCKYPLNCGHMCTKKCHPDDQEHEKYQCMKPCRRVLCDLNHRCPKICYEDCGACRILVSKLMPGCLHMQDIQCSTTDLSKGKCCYPLTETLGCGHTAQIECHEDLTEVKCKQSTVKLLPCGHSRKLMCFEDIFTYNCQETVTHTCTRYHVAFLTCAEKTAGVQCKVEIEKVCPVNRDHRLKIPCYKYSEKFVCRILCGSELPCGHSCSGQCGICQYGVKHIPCQQKCTLKLPCGHNCTGKCGESCVPCQYPCPKRCFHSKIKLCAGVCGEICTLCDLPCENQCRHSKCTRLCGEPCNRARCNRSCDKLLSCGHKCHGVCGEPCPPCKMCQEEIYKQMQRTIDIEMEDNMWFVLLQPCGHVVEVNYMDRLFDVPPSDYPRPMNKYECPICHCIITLCPRYGKELNEAFVELQEAKALLIRANKTKVDLLEAIEKSGVENAHDLYISLVDTEGREPDTFTKRGIGCIYIMSHLEFLKIKAATIRKKNRGRHGTKSSQKDNENIMQNLNDTITDYKIKVSRVLDDGGYNALASLSTKMKYTYIKTSLEVMFMAKKSENQRCILIQLIDMINDASEECNEAELHHIKQMIMREFQHKEGNDVFDFMAQLEYFFELRIQTVKSNIWIVCSEPGT